MRYVTRRLGFFIVTLWACLTINFVLPRLMPGNPAEAMMARYKGRINGQALKALEIAFGVNSSESSLHQYFTYLGNMFTGHFGTSLTFFPDPVSQVVFAALPWTLGLVGITTVLAFAAGTLVGMVAAWRRGSTLDGVMPPIFVIISAFPYFFLALMVLLVFSVTLGWFPQGFGYSNTDTVGWSWHFIEDVLKHAFLPAIVILVTSIGGWVLTMRNNMISTLSEDYVRMARRQGTVTTADHVQLRRPKCRPPQPGWLRHVARLRGVRGHTGRVRLLLPRSRVHAPASGGKRGFCPYADPVPVHNRVRAHRRPPDGLRYHPARPPDTHSGLG